jgi:hypothetical protein
MILKCSTGVADALQDAASRQGTDAGAVRVDRGQRYLADRGDEVSS